MDGARSLIARWFGAWSDDEPLAAGDASMKLWWSKDEAVDAQLREAFEAPHLAAARGELDGWADEAEGAVARVLLLDQVPRNIYRGTAHAFATDGLARQASKALHDGPLWEQLPPIHRYFALMPLMHSEALADHALGLERFTALQEATAGMPRAGVFAGAVDFAHRHRRIIERFGRYPHRNAAMGRDSTAEELAFLAGPGSSF